MIFAARNCMLPSKSSFTLEDVSQATQQCEIEGQITEFYNASPNSKIAVFSKDTEHEINFIIHIIFDIRLDMII